MIQTIFYITLKAISILGAGVLTWDLKLNINTTEFTIGYM